MLPLLLATIQGPTSADTAAFADSATRVIVVRAIARHGSTDETLRDYTARFRYRLSFGLGRRRWAVVPNASVEEQEGRVQWSHPNDIRVEIEGRRAAARTANLRISSSFDRPWFIPRSLGDSIRVFGNDIPPRAALHPLAEGGPDWYRYRLTDSVQLVTPEGRRVKLLGVQVVPVRIGPSMVTGRLWLDADLADLVRFSFRFVGTELWLDRDQGDDDLTPERVNRIVSRVLTLDADLEYALQDGRFWMPYRQVVSGRVELPWFGELVVPFRATTTFEDYELNTGRPIAFQVPLPPDVTDPDSVSAWLRARRDSIGMARRESGERHLDRDAARDEAGLWENGRFEIHRPPRDSLTAYRGWEDSLSLTDDPAVDGEIRRLQGDLERMAVRLPPELTGIRTHGFAWERIIDAFRYNRVQGLAPGLEYAIKLPGTAFTTLRLQARFGLSDSRVIGLATVVREAPGARWSLAGYRDIRSGDPFARANTFGNSLNAVFAGHDDGDYHLVHGGRLTRESSVGVGLELTTAVLVEEHRPVRREAGSWINDALGGTGRFPPNPPVGAGTYGGFLVRLDCSAFRTRWQLAADGLGREGKATGRLYGSAISPLVRAGGWVTLTLRAGITTADPLPEQAFRLGGSGTIRGFDYGTLSGQSFWAAQLDWPLRRGIVQPVLFADAGQAGDASGLFGTGVLAGGGGGVMLLGGLLRFDLSHPISDGGSGLRFDLGARAVF